MAPSSDRASRWSRVAFLDWSSLASLFKDLHLGAALWFDVPNGPAGLTTTSDPRAIFEELDEAVREAETSRHVGAIVHVTVTIPTNTEGARKRLTVLRAKLVKIAEAPGLAWVDCPESPEHA